MAKRLVSRWRVITLSFAGEKKNAWVLWVTESQDREI